MLKKLLKHDFISIWRLALPIFAIAAGIVLFAYTMCTINFDNPVLRIFSTFLFPTGIIVIIVASVLAVALPVLHFYRSLMTGEGYLSFTLPVTTYQLVLSKLIVGTITTLFNMAFTIGMLLLLFSTKTNLSISLLKSLTLPDGTSATSVIVVIALCIIVSLICQTLYFYLAICLGQMLCKNKIVGSALGYAIIYIANQAFNMVLLLIMFLCIGFQNVETFMGKGSGVITLLSVVSGEYVILGIAAYILSCRILKNRLNLS